MDKRILYAGSAALAAYFWWVSRSTAETKPAALTRTGSVSAPGVGFAQTPIVVTQKINPFSVADKTVNNAINPPIKTQPNPANTVGFEQPGLLQNIQNWMGQNLGASDFEIRKTMDQYGVTPENMVAALGGNIEDVQRRYDAVAPSGVHENIRQWMGQNLGANDFEIRQAMDKYRIKPEDMVAALGGNLEDVQRRYDAAL